MWNTTRIGKCLISSVVVVVVFVALVVRGCEFGARSFIYSFGPTIQALVRSLASGSFIHSWAMGDDDDGDGDDVPESFQCENGVVVRVCVGLMCVLK